MKELPKLTMSGFTDFVRNKENEKEINEADLAKIEWFIRTYFAKIKHINLTRSSYGLKHILEDHLGFYVSNGQCIKAFINCGFEVRPDGINAYFNVSKKDVKFAAVRRKTGMNC